MTDIQLGLAEEVGKGSESGNPSNALAHQALRVLNWELLTLNSKKNVPEYWV